MKLLLLFLLFPILCHAREVTIAWDANPVSDAVTGYRIYTGTEGNYKLLKEVPGDVTTSKITLPDTNVDLVMTAHNAANLESLPSEVLNIPVGPSAPTAIRISPPATIIININ